MSDITLYTLAEASGYHAHDNHLTNYVSRELSTEKQNKKAF